MEIICPKVWSQIAANEIRDIHATALAVIGGVFIRVIDQDVEIEIDSDVVGPIYMNTEGRNNEFVWRAKEEITKGLRASGINVFDTEEEWLTALKANY